MRSSREGKRFFLATVLIVVASLNTGNNLIYLILSMMLSIGVLSVVILGLNMRGLTLSVFQSQPVFANSPADIDITISNAKKIPSYSVRVLLPQQNGGDAYFPEIPGRSHLSKSAPVLYSRRGRYGHGDIFFESSFPFIFLSKRVSSRSDREVIVYPEIKKIDGIIPESALDECETCPPKFGRGDTLAMIREFRYGDDWRRIHWKASAKTAKLMVKEYAGEELQNLTVILDNLSPPDPALFEKAISFAASVSDRFLQEGFLVRLLTCRKLMPFGSGREHLFKILGLLALIEGQDSWECQLSDDAESSGFVILILNENSPLQRLIPISDMVVYAANL